jgi:hypothetical protein
MIDKYNLDLKIMKQIVKESVNIYNELRPHYSNYMLTQTKCTYKVKLKWEHIKQKTLAKRFCKCLIFV